MPEVISAIDKAIREEASRLGREALDAHLLKCTPEQRDAFWHAIGLYYSARRHPGAEPAPRETPAAAM